MKIVTIGGGTGGSIIDASLSGDYPDLTAIVTSFDNGGSSGILRREFGMLPQGDIHRRIFAQKNIDNSILESIYNYRFADGENRDSSLETHSVGNLMILAATKIWGEKLGLEKICEMFKIRGKVLPVTYSYAELGAKLSDGSRVLGEDVVGQTLIDRRDKTDIRKIEKVYLTRETVLNSEVKKSILHADYLILCPGDFYTSLIPNFLVPGFCKAVKKSKAKTIFVCNIMTKASETRDFKLSNFILEVEKYLQKKVDYIVFNQSKISSKLLRKYKTQEFAVPVVNDLDKRDLRVHSVDMLKQNGSIRHDQKLFKKAFEKIVALDEKNKLFVFDLDDTLIPTSKYRDEYKQNTFNNLAFFPNVLKILKKIGRSKCLLLTYDKYGQQGLKLKHLKASNFFSQIIVVSNPQDKEKILNQIKTSNDPDKTEIFVVGDKHDDGELFYASKLGMRTICVALPGGAHLNKLYHNKFDLLVEKEDDLTKILDVL